MTFNIFEFSQPIIAACPCRVIVRAAEVIGIGTPKCVMLFHAITVRTYTCVRRAARLAGRN